MSQPQHVAFVVTGIPRPKQSFKIAGDHGYTPARVKAWQNKVADEADLAMHGRDPMQGPLEVAIDFYLPDRHRRDLDNLSKAVLDACNHIVWHDDQQVEALHLHKHYGRDEIGITVYVQELQA